MVHLNLPQLFVCVLVLRPQISCGISDWVYRVRSAKKSHEKVASSSSQTNVPKVCSLSRQSLYADKHWCIGCNSLWPRFRWRHLANFWYLLRRLLWCLHRTLVSCDSFLEAELLLLLVRHLGKETGRLQRFEPKQLQMRKLGAYVARETIHTLFFSAAYHQKVKGVFLPRTIAINRSSSR